MVFTTLKGTKVAINEKHVVAVEAASDDKGTPIIGMANVLLHLPPPNVMNAGHISMVVRGDFRMVAAALGIAPTEFEDTVSDDIPF